MCGLTSATTTYEHTEVCREWNSVEHRWRAGRRGPKAQVNQLS
jgi:hypothetical protein